MIPRKRDRRSANILFFFWKKERFRLPIKKQLKQVSSKCGFLPPAPDLPMTSHVESSDQGLNRWRFMCKQWFELTFALKLLKKCPYHPGILVKSHGDALSS